MHACMRDFKTSFVKVGWNIVRLKSSDKIPNEAKSEQQAYNAFYGFLCVC